MVKESEDAKDIVAVSFERLSGNRSKFKNADELWGWLYTVARNEAIDCLRKRDVRRKTQNELAQAPEPECREPLESEIVYAKLMEKISLVIQSLPESRKRIFQLHYGSGMDTRAIARKLNIAEQTVRNQLNRAIIQLRQALL
jgi:RNA polymerase sigma factor (sigma-70 family)